MNLEYLLTYNVLGKIRATYVWFETEEELREFVESIQI